MDDDRIEVTVTEEERQEVATSLEARRSILKKEKAKLKDMGISPEPVEEVIRLHLGDGATSGLVAKFAPQDNGNLFDSPQPKGKVLVRLNLNAQEPEEMEYVHLLDPSGCEQEVRDFCPQWFPEVVEGELGVPLLVDEAGELFQVVPKLSVGFEYLGPMCSEDGCWAPASRGGLCSTHYVAPEPEPEPEPQNPTENIRAQERQLVGQMLQDAAWLPVARRELLLGYLEEAPDEWVVQALKSLPKGEEPPEQPLVKFNLDPYEGLSFTQVASILAREADGLPREYLEGKGTGQNGKLTKGDVEDAISAWVSAEARAAQEGTTVEEAQETIKREKPQLQVVE